MRPRASRAASANFAERRRSLPSPNDADAEGPEGLQADRQRRANASTRRQVERHGESSRIDITVPDMLTPLVAHPPRFGAQGRQRSTTRRRARSRASWTSSRSRGRRGLRREHVGGDQGPRRAEGRLGRLERPRSRSHAPRSIAEYRRLPEQRASMAGKRRRCRGGACRARRR